MGAGYSIRNKGNDSAEIYIYEDVGESWFGGVSAKAFADDLKALGKVSTLDVRLNSYGGEVFDGLAIYRQLVEHPARVIVHIDGIAASIASVIAMAGDEILIAEAGFMMVHPAQGGVLGASKDMREMADLLDRITASIREVYAGRTGATPEQISAWVDADTWFTAEQAVANGFADSIAENMLLAAKADLSAHQTKLKGDQVAALTTGPTRNAGQALIQLRSAADLMAAPPAAEPPSVPLATRPHHLAASAHLTRLQARIAARA